MFIKGCEMNFRKLCLQERATSIVKFVGKIFPAFLPCVHTKDFTGECKATAAKNAAKVFPLLLNCGTTSVFMENNFDPTRKTVIM